MPCFASFFRSVYQSEDFDDGTGLRHEPRNIGETAMEPFAQPGELRPIRIQPDSAQSTRNSVADIRETFQPEAQSS